MYFDAHSDIWTDVTMRRLKGETNVLKRCHLERFRRGNVEGSIFVIWIDPPYTENYSKRTYQIMDAMQAEITEAQDFMIVHNYEEMLDARRQGKIYIFIGVEGMAHIGSDISKIDEYYAIGARHGMLTWNEENDLGAGAMTGKRLQPLSEAGKKAARYMQDKGMILDVSHLNVGGFWDIAKIATKPFIASHSNASALCDAPRNLNDDQLRAIRDVNGVVGLNSFNPFIHDDPKLQDVEHLALHAAHMIDVMGIEHVGCGFDFCEFLGSDTMSSMISTDSSATIGLEDCTKIYKLFECFDKMGMSKADQEKIARLNFQRVIKDVLG